MKISDIRDIVRTLEKYRPAGKRFTPLNDRSLISKFQQLIEDGTISTDKEAAESLYGENFSPTKYKTLKTYYLSNTINNITHLEISQSNLSEYVKAKYKANKYLFFIGFLLTSGCRNGALHFSRRVLKIADKYEFHTIALTLLNEFKKEAMQTGKEKEYVKYLILYEERMELLTNEAKIISLEERITIHFAKSLFVKDKMKDEVKVACDQATALLKNSDSYFARISYYRLLYIHWQLQGHPIQSAAICDTAIKYMIKKKHLSPNSRFAEFSLYKLENYILIRDYENGLKTISYCNKKIQSGMNLWFTLKEYEFLLMMQTTKFIEAEQIYNDVISHERFTSLAIHLRERWQIFGMHIQYVSRSSDSYPNGTKTGPFKKSFLIKNKVFKDHLLNFPTYQKDKRGFNVAILTLNVLVALEENKLDVLLMQEEALSSYRFKYLNEKHCKQSFILFKLIRLVTKNDFDLEKIMKKAVAIENELETHKLAAGEIFECIQIIPPQWVWRRIKAILANRK